MTIRTYDVVILGAGASGLMCAAWLTQHSTLKIGLIDGNDRVGAKLKISGGGKCNITNVDVQAHHYLGDAAMLESVFKQFGQSQLLQFLEANGIRPVIRKGRYYFCRDSSDEVITVLKQLSRGVDTFLGQKILNVSKSEKFHIQTNKGAFEAATVVVATGGISFKTLGATGVGLEVAKAFSHTVTPFTPALVGLTLQPQQFWMKELTGISFPVRIEAGGRHIEEDMLFAHKGISGPAVLSASLYWHKGTISVDFLPDARVESLCAKSKKLVSTAIPLPKRFMKVFLSALEIGDKPCEKLTKEERERLVTLHHYVFAPSGTFGFAKAEVSRGGVACSEIDAETMQSKKTEGLYFIGEVVDVTGELGGYNFQWAFSSAVVASKSISFRKTC